MQIVSTTDGKYIGLEVPDDLKIGDTVTLEDDFEISVQFIFSMENGHTRLGSPNYQLELEE